MSSSTTHPLSEAWLRDLELLLHGIDPGERAEVLAGVREHLDGSLPPGASDDDVRRVLADLGSPQSVADEAYAGRAAPAAQPSPAAPHVTAMRWLPVVVVILQVLALATVLTTVGALSGYSKTSTTDASGKTLNEVIDYSYAFPEAAMGSLLAALLFWLPAGCLVMLSPLYTGRLALANVMLAPAAASVMTLLPDLGWLLTHSEMAIGTGAVAGLLVVILGGAVFLKRTSRSALAAAQAGVPA